jgi:zona occludens toxin (predicted ATPase)
MNTQPTSDQAQRLVIIRTEDRKVAGTTHRHSGCDKCLVR